MNVARMHLAPLVVPSLVVIVLALLLIWFMNHQAGRVPATKIAMSVTNSLGMEFVAIPGGSFMMGNAVGTGMPENEVRALAFFSLVLTIVSLIFVNRSFSASLTSAIGRPNPALALVLIAVITSLGLTLLWPFASGLFRFGPLHFDDLAVALGAGVLMLVLLELLKPLWHAKAARA